MPRSGRGPYPFLDEDRQGKAGHRKALHHPIAHVLVRIAVLASALGRQQDFLDDALASQRAIRIGKGNPAPGQGMAFRPGLAIGRTTGADAVEESDKAVGILRRL